MFGSHENHYVFLRGELDGDIQELQNKANELAKDGYVIRETKTFGAMGEKIIIIFCKD